MRALRQRGLLLIGLALMMVGGLVVPAFAQADPDGVNVGDTLTDLDGELEYRVERIIGGPQPQHSDVIDNAQDTVLPGGAHCRVVATDPFVSGAFVGGSAEHQCEHQHLTTTIDVRIWIKISGQWHKIGPEGTGTTANDTSAQADTSTGCVEGSFNYQTRGIGTATGVDAPHNDKGRSGATRLTCANLVGAISVDEFLRTAEGQ